MDWWSRHPSCEAQYTFAKCLVLLVTCVERRNNKPNLRNEVSARNFTKSTPSSMNSDIALNRKLTNWRYRMNLECRPRRSRGGIGWDRRVWWENRGDWRRRCRDEGWRWIGRGGWRVCGGRQRMCWWCCSRCIWGGWEKEGRRCSRDRCRSPCCPKHSTSPIPITQIYPKYSIIKRTIFTNQTF